MAPGLGPRSGRPGASQTGLKMEVQGLEVAVSQWVCRVGVREEIMEPVVWLPRMGPQPACMQTSAPVSAGAGDQDGLAERWERRADSMVSIEIFPRLALRAARVQFWRETAALKRV